MGKRQLPIHAEHLYSSIFESILNREASLAKSADQKPVTLLISPPAEHHTMVKAILSEGGITSLHLSGTLPQTEIVAATSACALKAVGVSASCHYPPRMLRSLIRKRRKALPDHISLWCGGAGMHRIVDLSPGVSVNTPMQQLLAICRAMNLTRKAIAPAMKDKQ